MKNLIVNWEKGNKAAFNAGLVELFNRLERNLDATMEALNGAGVNLSRRQVIGKLSIMGEKNIVPKAPTKPKADNGPTKKELIAQLAEKVGLVPADLLTFNNVKKAEIKRLIDAIK